MSYPKTAYLAWAGAHFGRVEYNLASSGMRDVRLGEVAAGAEPYTMTSLLLPGLDETRGYATLRERIAALHGTRVERVAAVMGASHGIWAACAAVLSPGDHVLVEHPVYEPLALVPRALGAEVTHFERPSESGYAIDEARVLAALTARTRLVIISNLHNPSGARTSVEAIAKLARALAPRNVMLLVDEVYAPFDTFLDARGLLCATAAHAGANVIVVSSLTKTFGCGNTRVGWVVAEPEITKNVQYAITANVGMLPVQTACTGVYFIDHLPWLAERARSMLGTKRARAAAWAAEHGLAWSAPEAGLFGFARGLPLTGDALRERLERGLEEHQVLAVPGAFFGVDDGIRLAWACDDPHFDEGLVRLAVVLGLK